LRGKFAVGRALVNSITTTAMAAAIVVNCSAIIVRRSRESGRRPNAFRGAGGDKGVRLSPCIRNSAANDFAARGFATFRPSLCMVLGEVALLGYLGE
jgi:hypothetical protein